jgi:hypothetical protein
MGQFHAKGKVIVYATRKRPDGFWEALVNAVVEGTAKVRSTAYRRAKAAALALWKSITYKIESVSASERDAFWAMLYEYAGATTLAMTTDALAERDRLALIR